MPFMWKAQTDSKRKPNASLSHVHKDHASLTRILDQDQTQGKQNADKSLDFSF